MNEGLHPAIIKNPSTERWWDEKCISCHKNQITSFQKNSHYSLSRIINQTRYLWGKTGILKTGGDPDDWKKLIPESEAQGHTMSELVDNLLSKKCMACHFNADAKEDATGRKRNAGCAACHIPLDQNSGKPLYGHIMQKTVSDTVCLSCHSGNYVGGDYYGYFEHDYHTEYNMPYESKPLFGAYQHRLSVDIHKTAGLRCMDCHKSEGVMGKSGVTVTCEDCHGGFNQSKKISAKPFNKNITSHNSFHKNVSCTACHAQW
ncbi:cytochrome c3 family protein, partial [bacterium]|nr:cytochrome c3 family protein [bacterium]